MEIKIRKGKISDIKRVSYITKLAYKKPFGKSNIVTVPHIDKTLVEDFKNKKFDFLVAIANEKIVGCVKYRNKNEDNIYLFQLVVLKTYRGKSIGNLLIRGLEKICIKNNIKTLSLDCMIEKGLPPYYEKFGFNIKKVEEKNGKHIAYMEKVIKL